MTLQYVPIIDIAPFFSGDEAAKTAVANAVDQACREIGFLIITGHGVRKQLLDDMRDVSREFFALSETEKLQIRRLDPNTPRGYDPPLGESLSVTIGQYGADLKESFTIGNPDRFEADGATSGHLTTNIWPRRPPALRKVFETYYRRMNGLAGDMHRLLARALRLDDRFFASYLDKPFDYLRAINYPDQPEPPLAGQLRAGEHTDYDDVTFLITEDKPGGLQTRNRRGEWVDVQVIPDAFIVNIGDIMMRWTNDKWVSNRHRVVNPPRDKAVGSQRLSIVYFSSPNFDAVIECLPTCQGPEHPPKYPPVSTGDYLVAKVTAQTTAQIWSKEDRLKFGTQDTETRFEDLKGA